MLNSKLVLLLIGFLSIALTAQAQIYNPVQWKKEVKKTGENEYEVRLTAEIEKGWKVYSATEKEDGPVPFNYEINETINTTTLTKFQSIEKPKKYYDPLFEMDVEAFMENVTFVMKVKLNDTSQDGEIRLAYEFMTCNDTRCLAPKYLETNFIILP